MEARKVLLVEFNEINWAVIDRLLARYGGSYLPNFVRLRAQGAWGTPVALEKPPHLDPWITWVTVHTGVPREVHGATVLEQDSGTITAKRTWDYAAEAGLSVGVFGSVSAYPPRPVPGFMVPGPFAPGNETFPAYLEPVQAINRLYTQVHNRTGNGLGPREMAKVGLELLRFGLKPKTVAEIARQLASERIAAHRKWKRPALQPLLNMDFFTALYRRYRPHFATWHSNHAAHYMHHYWRAWDDTGFLTSASAEERAHFGKAVPYGYKLCDRLLGRFLAMADERTVLVVASSMGQQPYVSEQFRAGRIVVRVRDMDRLLAIVGRDGIVEVVPTMVPQWNLRIPDLTQRQRVRQRFERAERIIDSRVESAFNVEETEGILTVTPRGLADKPAGIRYRFVDCPGAVASGYDIDDLFATDAPTPKQGMHHPDGLLLMYGPGIARGVNLGACSNLDIAPTLLSLLGVPVPRYMQEKGGGRVLAEAFANRPWVGQGQVAA